MAAYADPSHPSPSLTVTRPDVASTPANSARPRTEISRLTLRVDAPAHDRTQAIPRFGNQLMSTAAPGTVGRSSPGHRGDRRTGRTSLGGVAGPSGRSIWTDDRSTALRQHQVTALVRFEGAGNVVRVPDEIHDAR